MEFKQAAIELSKIGIEACSDHIVFVPKGSKNSVRIAFGEIVEISIDRTKADLFEKLVYWGQRLLFFNSHFGYSPFDNDTDHRYSYDFLIVTTDSRSLIKRVKDFNLLSVAKAIETLNEIVTGTTHNNK